MLMNKYKTTIYYRLYEGMEDQYVDGRYIGKAPKYGEPVAFRIHVGWARGSSDNDMFGTNLDYDKPMVTNWMDCPIDENTVLIIDHSPLEVPYDYIVKRVAKSKNYITYAIKKVEVQ